MFDGTIFPISVGIKSLIKFPMISAEADGGPRSRVRTAGHSAQPPIDVSGNFPAHVSAESPSKFSKKLRHVIQIRQIH